MCIPLVCRICLKSTFSLYGHLMRRCMKSCSSEIIKNAVKEAKESVVSHVHHGMVFQYENLQKIFDETNRRKVITLLESSGCFIDGKPEKSLSLKTGPEDEQLGEEEKMQCEKHHEICKTHICEVKTPGKCLMILKVAKQDFITVMQKLAVSSKLSVQENLHVLYYLEAILLLKYLQKPIVVKGFLVEEWLERTHQTEDGMTFAIITVMKKKTGQSRETRFALNAVEENWFHMYFTMLRPKMLKNSKALTESSPGKDYFFVSSEGEEVYNATLNATRLIERYRLPKVKRMEVVKTFKDTAVTNLCDQENSIVLQYIKQANGNVNGPSEMLNFCLASMLMEKLANYNSDCIENRVASISHAQVIEPQEQTNCNRNRTSTIAAAAYRYQKMDNESAFKRMLEEFPVTLNGQPPKKKIRVELVGEHSRYCYRSWRLLQQALRREEMQKHFTRRIPTEHKIKTFYMKMEWNKNCPGIQDVIEGWKPTANGKQDLGDQGIASLVERQSWRGLHATIDAIKGKKVMTTQVFKKGEIICDYHGMVITAEEGKRMMRESQEEEMGYLFFFQDRLGRKLCVDAKTQLCVCHTNMETIGRLINHSRKKFNIKPTQVTLVICGSIQNVILFTALRDINVEEELLFDYGVSRKSFNGEGEELELLDT